MIKKNSKKGANKSKMSQYEEKLNRLYNECICELNSIGINILDNEKIGTIDIKLSNRNNKRYGCCKQDMPDKNSKYITKVGRKRYIHYAKYLKHHIEVSPWVMELNDKIIKNTIMHEIIHCFPLCDNHGTDFKKYAKYINLNLDYDIKTLGNKKEDYNKSNIEYEEKNTYNYVIQCQKCGLIIHRKRLKKDLEKNYRCGKCGGKLKVIENIK